MNLQRLVVWAAVLSAVLTTVAIASPSLRFVIKNPELHLAFVTAEAMIGLLAGYLALSRLRRWRRLDHLLLGAGLAFLGMANLAFAVVPTIFWDSDEALVIWGATAGRVGGAILLASAAIVSPRRLRLTRRQVFFAGLAITDALLAVGVVAVLLSDSLPRAVVDGDLNGWFAGLLVLMMAAQGVAAIGFAIRSRHSVDRLAGAVAVGCAVGVAAVVNHLVNPAGLAESVALADLLRFCFYLVILAGVLREMDANWRSTLVAAALDERRRIARDLHDGLAQELASVKRNLDWIEDTDDPFVARARASAERGLAAARQAIDVLGDTPDRDLADLLAETAGTVAARVGTRLELDLKRSVRVGPAEREALMRIAAEAIANAGRHGHADLVRVELVDQPRVRLRVTDTGRGFNAPLQAWTADGGFGLSDMQNRALEIGAHYRLESRPGQGTQVEVAL